MRILITGAHGLVGRALTEQFQSHTVFALGHRELDITDASAVNRVIHELQPEVTFNCAVIGVDDCEENPRLAEAVNVAGPAHLADAVRERGAAIVHFSTNYVFDGERGAARASDQPLEAPAARATAGNGCAVPNSGGRAGHRGGTSTRTGTAQPCPTKPSDFYTSDDEPRPINVYGRTKLEGERAVVQRCERAFIVRTSWVFGEGKESFLSSVARRLASGERVKAICDIWASTTYVADLVRRVDEIVRTGPPATYHIVNDGVCSYAVFAREAARLTGADVSLIDQVTEAQMLRSPRPRCTPMRCLESERLGLAPMRHWTAALADFIAAG
jgi:dTDP-4-dehydrorhamnose reductase